MGKNGFALRGIYLWGGVGRGKTMLMDIFYQSLNNNRVIRKHFHHFMLHVHEDLKKLNKTRDPLVTVSQGIAKKADVLCLDEFQVTDITDAMILAGLLRALFAEGVVLVTTSNIPPKDLYRDGLQRSQFLPAIDLLQNNCHVLNLDGTTDYRLQTLKRDGTYHHPLNEDTATRMQKAFDAVSSHTRWADNSIEILGREIAVIAQSEGAVWFQFKTLCDSPRSQNDYIEIVRRHHTIFISNLTAMNDQHNDVAKRFLNFIDVAYDSRVKLVISASNPIQEIYSGKKLEFEFARVLSRLIEMQSEEYLQQSHKC